MVAAPSSAAAPVVAAQSACAPPKHLPASAVVGSSSVAPRPDHEQTDTRCSSWETTRSRGDVVADASQSKGGEDEDVPGGDEMAQIGSPLEEKQRRHNRLSTCSVAEIPGFDSTADADVGDGAVVVAAAVDGVDGNVAGSAVSSFDAPDELAPPMTSSRISPVSPCDRPVTVA